MSADLAGFREQVRRWAAEHVPAGWAETHEHAEPAQYLEFQRWWLRELQAAGWLAPHWAPEHGGSGLDLASQVVLFEELAAAGAPSLPAYFVALNHTYGTLAEWGSPEQCARFLPRILSGDDVWCQGFSEPEAGSDLAGLRTRAVRDGDCYVVTGQKVWSSNAALADWCLLLVRTDPDLPKRKGISFLLLDLHSPGVEVRPIRQATGESEFCELFLTDVRVPVANRVGEENDGWRIAQSTLSAERGPTLLELSARLERAIGWLVDQARRSELEPGRAAIDDPAVREELAGLHTEVTILRLLCRKVVDDLVRRGGSGPESSIIKVFYSELLQRVADAGVGLSGLATHEAAARSRTAGWESGHWMLDYVNSWGWISGGGTNHIQRNVVAERVLGLPRDPVAS